MIAAFLCAILGHRPTPTPAPRRWCRRCGQESYLSPMGWSWVHKPMPVPPLQRTFPTRNNRETMQVYDLVARAREDAHVREMRTEENAYLPLTLTMTLWLIEGVRAPADAQLRAAFAVTDPALPPAPEPVDPPGTATAYTLIDED